MLKLAPFKEILKVSKEAELTGNYETGLNHLAFFWDYQSPDKLPSIDDYELEEFAYLFKSCGILYGFWGVSQKNVQEISKDILSECRTIFLSLNKKDEAISCANYLALAYFRMGALDEARIWLDEALQVLPNDHIVKLHALTVELLINIKEQRSQQVIETSQRVFHLFNQPGNDYLSANFLTYLGIAYKLEGAYQIAAKYTQTACRLWAKINHYQYLSYAENNLACLFRAMGDIDNAFQHASKALGIAEKISDIRQIGGIYDTHALICFDLKQFDIALYYAEKAIEALQKTDNYLYLIEYMETKVRILLEMGKYSEAVLLCAEAIEIARQYLNPAATSQLTKTVHDFIADTTVVKIFRESRLVSGYDKYKLCFENLPEKINRPLSCVEIHSSRYQYVGIEKGCLAVIQPIECSDGDFAAIRNKNTNECFLGFINIQSDNFKVNVNRKLAELELCKIDFEVIGKVVGYCDEPVTGEYKLKVKPLRIER